MKLRAAVLAASLLLSAAPAFSQACSMCYSTAKATSKEGQRAISKGVVVLLVPPVGFMTLGVWTAFRYARKRDLEKGRSLELPDLEQITRASVLQLFEPHLCQK